jgi:hypothetical protein
VRAVSDTTLAVIPAEAFGRLTKKFPKASAHIVQGRSMNFNLNYAYFIYQLFLPASSALLSKPLIDTWASLPSCCEQRSPLTTLPVIPSHGHFMKAAE